MNTNNILTIARIESGIYFHKQPENSSYKALHQIWKSKVEWTSLLHREMSQ